MIIGPLLGKQAARTWPPRELAARNTLRFPAMPKLPYVEFHAPVVGYKRGQIDPLVSAPGIVEILWGDQRDDGTFAEVRIIFADDAVMLRFLDAGMASVHDHRN